MSILYIFITTGTVNLLILSNIQLNYSMETYLWIAFFIAFSVKVPLFPIHIWLPEAHVEATTEASVILAAIILKVGLYGLLRILLPCFTISTLYYASIIGILNILAILYTSLVTLRQIDIKRIIAYSSIGHMNLAMLAIITLEHYALLGSIILMLGHAFISGGLFFLIGMLYTRFKTKLIFYYAGISTVMPVISSIFFYLLCSNFSLPLTINFIPEFLILYTFIYLGDFSIVFSICVSFFICTGYSLWLYNRLFFGTINFKVYNYGTDISKMEMAIVIPLIICIITYGIIPNLLINIFYIDCLLILL